MSIYKKNQSKALPSVVESPYKKRLIQIAKMANYEPIASIPNLNNDFNFTYAKDGLLKRKAKPEPEPIQSIPYSPFHSQQRNSPNHGRLPRIDSKPSKIEYHPTNASQPNDQHLTLDTRLQTQQYNLGSSNARSNSPSFTLQGSRQKNSKKIKNRYKMVKIYSQQNSEQEDDTQYSSNATPGSGQYSLVDNKSFLNSNKKFTNWSFGIRAERFTSIKPKTIAKSVQKIPQEKKTRKQIEVIRRRKLIPFLSCSIKQYGMMKEKVPGPQDYNPRNGIEQELIRKIQRNFKGNFGVCEERFRSMDRYPNVAPGIYSIPPQNQSSLGSYYFLSQQKRFK